MMPKEEENLIGRYAKIILKGDINEGKYYLITSNTRATRLFDNVENCSFSNNHNWEIMPKDFKYTGQDNFPQYVKCVESWHSVWTTDKVYKTEKEQLDFPNTLRVKDNTGEVIKVYSWDAPKTFKISTEEEYLAQQTPKEEIMEKEDLSGRWLKCIKKNYWSDYGKRPEVGEYVQVKRGTMNSTYLDVINKTGKEESFTLTRLTKREEFTLMPIGFSPDSKKEECSKEYMPKYVEWVDNLGGGRCGKMCLDAYLEKGKIFDTSNDGILPNNCGNSWKKLWQFYYYNFTESTEKEYDAQNNIIRVKMSDTSSTGIKGTNPWLIDEVGQYDSRYYTTNLWSNTTGEKKLGRGYAVDVYEKKDKSIKQIELPKPKKRLIF